MGSANVEAFTVGVEVGEQMRKHSLGPLENSLKKGTPEQEPTRIAPLAGVILVAVSEERTQQRQIGVGLCADCRFMRRIESERGSIFYRCERSATDPRYPKYPRLPVLQCLGYEISKANEELARD